MINAAQKEICANCFWNGKCEDVDDATSENPGYCDYYVRNDLAEIETEDYEHDLTERQIEYDDYVSEMNG